MLIIAISHGSNGDPFTTSAVPETGQVDPYDSTDCLAFICSAKSLPLYLVDTVLVVETDCQGTSEPEVTHNYTEFD